MATQLGTELATYEQHREELLARGEGRFVLIKGTEVVDDLYGTEIDAIREGYRRFGNVPFLVKLVVRVEVPVLFTSNLIAI